MAVPPGFAIRIGNMNRGTPYPVQVRLPSITDPDPRPPLKEPRLVGPDLDIVIPTDDARHTALGIFMSSWSLLERHLVTIGAGLLGVELMPAQAIMANMGMKQIADSLNMLAMRKLPEPDADVFINLTERLTKLNGKRNVIVHGYWVFEANIIVRDKQAMLATQFLRCTTPSDPKDQTAMANPRNQKQRVRYSFTLKRIIATARDADKLALDFADFARQRKLEPAVPAQPSKSAQDQGQPNGRAN